MKQSFRYQALIRRKEILASDRVALDSAITKITYSFLQKRKTMEIALYYSLPEEVDTHELLQLLLNEEFNISLPSILANNTMQFSRIYSIKDLKPGKFCLEPSAIDANYVTPDMVLVPLVAFDAKGNRIGYGKGFYDMALSKIPNTLKVGLAYSLQEIKVADIYSNDVPLDCIITENGVYTPSCS